MLGLSTECIQMVCSIIFMSMAAAVLLALAVFEVLVATDAGRHAQLVHRRPALVLIKAVLAVLGFWLVTETEVVVHLIVARVAGARGDA